jgi:TctA family transporter
MLLPEILLEILGPGMKTALLLPFTFSMDPIAAMALLLGLASTTATGDPIPAILFGVPGGAGSAATVLDGLPMAKRGEASRALSAAYMSSMMGGVFGAFLMAICIPILRPVMLYIGSPELLAFSVLGISFVATLSGNAPLRGLGAAALGVMIAMVGSDPQTGTLRYTLDTLYLWEGAPLVPIVLGLFALPELADLAIARTAPAGECYHLSTDRFISIRDLVKTLCELLGADFDRVVDIVDDRPGKDAAYTLDSTKARQSLSWSPTVGLEYGLRETVAWVASHFETLRTQPLDYIHKP